MPDAFVSEVRTGRLGNSLVSCLVRMLNDATFAEFSHVVWDYFLWDTPMSRGLGSIFRACLSGGAHRLLALRCVDGRRFIEMLDPAQRVVCVYYFSGPPWSRALCLPSGYRVFSLCVLQPVPSMDSRQTDLVMLMTVEWLLRGGCLRLVDMVRTHERCLSYGRLLLERLRYPTLPPTLFAFDALSAYRVCSFPVFWYLDTSAFVLA